jgi:DNA-binding LacI/PurR family transcriptional regulator
MSLKRNIRLQDIAEKTGYSIKTVSRALNDHPDVSNSTREKIVSIAKKYSYFPNLVAKSLRTKKAFTIGYIVPDITNEFYGKVGIVIEREFRKLGYSLLISFTEESAEYEIESIQLLLAKRVDGIVLATVGTTGKFLHDIIHRYHVPVVVIDNKEEGFKSNLVTHDNINGAYLLTKHLLEHGRERVACITGPLAETSAKDRLDGYKKALQEYGISLEERLIKVSNWRFDGGYEAMFSLLQRGENKPTAIFIGNSIMALGVYKALKKIGLKVPDDVALVAFDNLEFTEAIDPPLTTLENVEKEIGEIAAGLLLEKIRTKDIYNVSEHLVKAELCVRKSCGCT